MHKDSWSKVLIIAKDQYFMKIKHNEKQNFFIEDKFKLQGRRIFISFILPKFYYMLIYCYCSRSRVRGIVFDCPLLILPILVLIHLIRKDFISLGEVFCRKMIDEFFFDRFLPLYEYLSTTGHRFLKLSLQFGHSSHGNTSLLSLRL